MKTNLSSCGIDCAACKFTKEKNCPGCRVHKGKPFWGSCELYGCASGKHLPHCGVCQTFPCARLQEWAAGENPERIENLRAISEKG